ncbi:MAG TPA: hypothetical protein VG937_30400 [Polyangiaceae bacterium]|nr:hypothetical protein [Polyangiaceae bacterium]
MLENVLLHLADLKRPKFKRVTRATRASARRSAPPTAPEGWDARIREQARNLSRALEMLEQSLSMLGEPRGEPLGRAQCLRGASLIVLIAASELLVVAGWYEAQAAVIGGTRDES